MKYYRITDGIKGYETGMILRSLGNGLGERFVDGHWEPYSIMPIFAEDIEYDEITEEDVK